MLPLGRWCVSVSSIHYRCCCCCYKTCAVSSFYTLNMLNTGENHPGTSHCIYVPQFYAFRLCPVFSHSNCPGDALREIKVRDVYTVYLVYYSCDQTLTLATPPPTHTHTQVDCYPKVVYRTGEGHESCFIQPTTIGPNSNNNHDNSHLTA